MTQEIQNSATGSIFQTRWNDAGEDETAGYRRLSIAALLALGFGVLSLLILASIWFFFLGLVGIATSLAALAAIRRSDGLLTGAWMARCGLVLSILTLVGTATFWPYYHYRIRNEADTFFRLWFASLRESDLPAAYSAITPFWQRNPDPADTEKWWDTFEDNTQFHRAVHRYLDNNSLVTTLMKLGPEAEVSYYRTVSTQTHNGIDHVVMIYAVTYPAAEGGKETFFVKLHGKRSLNEHNRTAAGWSLERTPDRPVPLADVDS